MLMCEFRLVSRRYVTSILIKPKRMIAGYGQTEGNKEIVRRACQEERIYYGADRLCLGHGEGPRRCADCWYDQS